HAEMTPETLNEIAELLGNVGSDKAWSAKRSHPPRDLLLEIEDVGRIELPVPAQQAEELCAVARPARYGKGEETLHDPGVRDTWEIPTDLIRIDEDRWNRTLLPVLDKLRADLGLSTESGLRAELHSMLVYAPGQFFLPHQDSEKAEGMVGTLVVTLPSTFRGGSLVVAHRGERASYRGSAKQISFVAFYADCLHEVRPVKEGYRVVLTYNLMLEHTEVQPHLVGLGSEDGRLSQLVEYLDQHFEIPLPSRRRAWDSDAPDEAPPNRLVYLLDHQYTERGLSWGQLKGSDADRAALLRAAAEIAGCELVLALSEIHEIWSAEEPYSPWSRYGGESRSWRRHRGDWIEDYPAEDGPEAYELHDLIDSEITLTHWSSDSEQDAIPVVTHVASSEVCATTPTKELEAYESEYEGFMGNYGNTMDLWYRRAALVLWPQERGFAIRAEASPAWAVDRLAELLDAGELALARKRASSLDPFWHRTARREEGQGFLGRSLEVAEGLGAPELASSLLEPFRLEGLRPEHAEAIVALSARYGDAWTRGVLDPWSSEQFGSESDFEVWLGETLPGLCEALSASATAEGRSWIAAMVEAGWQSIEKHLESAPRHRGPSTRKSLLVELAGPALGVLESAENAVAEAACTRAVGVEALDLETLNIETVADELVVFLCSDPATYLPCLIEICRLAGKRRELEVASSPGLVALRRHAAEELETRLAVEPRGEDDWSIELPGGCDCELCETLAEFLSSPSQRRLDWPINKERRRHIHRRLDAHELPVSHTTKRSGRPYTLVLIKQRRLFDDEAKERKAWRADLEWLRETVR
ncbi:MAG: 2OG-Fe(II) oxygenase, partial [Holophagales bacterium]|nr:2OG-Fe(II) oxygenase [Holophagales bacterium]